MPNRVSRALLVAAGLSVWIACVSCSPEVGSEAWCEKLREKHKADWSTNEAVDFAKHCIFR